MPAGPHLLVLLLASSLPLSSSPPSAPALLVPALNPPSPPDSLMTSLTQPPKCSWSRLHGLEFPNFEKKCLTRSFNILEAVT